MSQEILVGPERRHDRPTGAEIAVLIEAIDPDGTVAEVARRHGITRKHIYQWRSEMRLGRLVYENGGPFLAVEYVGPPGGNSPDETSPTDDLIEVSLRKGRVLRAPASIPPGVLTSLIKAAEAA